MGEGMSHFHVSPLPLSGVVKLTITTGSCCLRARCGSCRTYSCGQPGRRTEVYRSQDGDLDGGGGVIPSTVWASGLGKDSMAAAKVTLDVKSYATGSGGSSSGLGEREPDACTQFPSYEVSRMGETPGFHTTAAANGLLVFSP
ncbi:unnamed protein product [Lota lota]